MAKKKIEQIKPKPQIKKESEEKKKHSKYIFFGVIIFIAISFIVYNNWINPSKPPEPKKVYNPQNDQPRTDPPPAQEPQFKKLGTLDFISAGEKKPARTIDIEIAENDSSREKGLMWRKTMTDEQGMLFIFDKQELHSFWMKNTILSLDIIFVSENNEIVKIQKKAKPYSLESIPSGKPAKFVVEVNGGFSDKYGIKEGDKIKFKKQ
jgi:uncharacterized membrane protein (UPF0127 family)